MFSSEIKLVRIMITLGNIIFLNFLGGRDGKKSACNAGDLGSVPDSGRSPGGVAWQPTPEFLLENLHGQWILAE